MEDLELSLRAANKARSTAESEASEATAALEETARARNEAVERAHAATRDAAAARAALDDAEEEAAEVNTYIQAIRYILRYITESLYVYDIDFSQLKY